VGRNNLDLPLASSDDQQSASTIDTLPPSRKLMRLSTGGKLLDKTGIKIEVCIVDDANVPFMKDIESMSKDESSRDTSKSPVPTTIVDKEISLGIGDEKKRMSKQPASRQLRSKSGSEAIESESALKRETDLKETGVKGKNKDVMDISTDKANLTDTDTARQLAEMQLEKNQLKQQIDTIKKELENEQRRTREIELGKVKPMHNTEVMKDIEAIKEEHAKQLKKAETDLEKAKTSEAQVKGINEKRGKKIQELAKSNKQLEKRNQELEQKEKLHQAANQTLKSDLIKLNTAEQASSKTKEEDDRIIQQLTTERDQLRIQIQSKDATAQIEQLKKQLADKEKDLNATKEKLAEQNEMRNGLEEELERVLIENDDKEELLVKSQAESKQQVESSNKMLTEMKGIVEQKEAELCTVQSQLSSEKTKAHKMETDITALESYITELKSNSSISKKTKELDDNTIKLLSTERDELKAEIQNCKAQNDNGAVRIRRLTELHEVSLNKINEVTAQLEKAKQEVAVQTKEKDMLQKQLLEELDMKQAFAEQLENMGDSLTQKENQVKMLQQSLKGKEYEVKNLTDTIESRDKICLQNDQSKMRLDRIKAGLDEAKIQLEKEQNNHNKRYQLLVDEMKSMTNTLKQYENDLLSEKQRAQKFQDENTACVAKIAILETAKATLTAEMKSNKNEYKTALGAMEKESNFQLSNATQKVRDLEYKLKESDMKYKANLDTIKLDLKIEKGHLNHKEKELIAVREGSQILEKELKGAELALANCQTTSDLRSDKIQELKLQMADVIENKEQLRQQLEENKQKIKDLEEERAQKATQLKTFVSLWGEKKQKLMDLQNTLHNHNDNLEKALHDKNEILSQKIREIEMCNITISKLKEGLANKQDLEVDTFKSKIERKTDTKENCELRMKTGESERKSGSTTTKDSGSQVCSQDLNEKRNKEIEDVEDEEEEEEEEEAEIKEEDEYENSDKEEDVDPDWQFLTFEANLRVMLLYNCYTTCSSCAEAAGSVTQCRACTDAICKLYEKSKVRAGQDKLVDKYKIPRESVSEVVRRCFLDVFGFSFGFKS